MPAKKPGSAKKATPAAVKKSAPIKKAAPAKKASVKKVAVARTDVFISYSQRDKAWMERLKTHLKPLERTNLNVWVDTKLRAGDKWRVEIEKALAQTKVAILLISPNFLASDFIDTNELPPLLKAAEKEGTTILPLLLSTSMFPLTALSEFQAINGPEHPLDLLSDGQVNQTLFQVAKRVHEIFMTPAKKSAVKAEVKSVAITRKTAAATIDLLNAPTKKAGSRVPVKSAAAPVSPRSPAASTSATQQALLVRRSGEWEVIPVHQAKIGKQLEMALRPASPAQVAFLTTLRHSSRDALASVVFRGHSYRCTQQDLHAVTENNRETWHLTADMQELLARTEVTYSNLTPDMQAQARAELLLLNSHPPEQSPMRWLSNSGFNDLTASPLPALFRQVDSSPTRFKQVAPLVITWFLHFTNTVQHIMRLSLTLKGQNVVIDFEGQRDASHREAPIAIRVTGSCSLAGATENTVLLGPIRSY